MVNFHAKEKLRGLGRKKANNARPSLALGMNPNFLFTYEYQDMFWDRMINASPLASYPGRANAPIYGRANRFDKLAGNATAATIVATSSDGLAITDTTGTFGTLKMDWDGTIYATNSLGITSFTYLLQEWFDVPSIPTGYMLLDLHGQGQISSLTGGTSIVADLGGGKYVLNMNLSAKVNRAFTVLRATMDLSGATGIRPTLTPCAWDGVSATDPTGYTAAGRVSSPDHAARMAAVCSYLRPLNWLPINVERVRGDTPTSLAVRTVEGKERFSTSDVYGLTTAQLVKFCNEAGIGMQYLISPRSDPALIAQQMTTLAGLDSSIVILELSNETWNNGFPSCAEVSVMGCRAGYDLVPMDASNHTSAEATARTIYCSNVFGNETATLIDVPSGAHYWCAINSLGQFVLQATGANAIGTPVPNVFVLGSTYAAGAMVIKSSGTVFLCVAQATTSNVPLPLLHSVSTSYTVGQTAVSAIDLQTYYCTTAGTSTDPATTPAKWRLATPADTPWLSAAPTAYNGSKWVVISNNAQTVEAHARWKTTFMKAAKIQADAAFSAAGKAGPLIAMNVQVQQNNPTTTLQPTVGSHAKWDGGWGLYDFVMMAPYQGGSLPLNNDQWWCHNGLPTTLTIGAVSAADKLAMNDPTITTAAGADAAVDTLLAKMVDPTTTYAIGDAWAQLALAQRNFYRGLVTTNGYSKMVYFGNYECGFTGNVGNGQWPENLAGYSGGSPSAWSNTKSYQANGFVNSYAWDAGDLWVAQQDNTNVRPSADGGTNWLKICRCTSGRTRSHELFVKILRSAGYGTWWTQYHNMLKTRLTDGYYCMFVEQTTMQASFANFRDWGLHETSSDVSAPCWQALVTTNADWKALAG